jgi:hypothetical protein
MLRGSSLKNGEKGKWSYLGRIMAQGAATCMFKNGVCVFIYVLVCVCVCVCMYLLRIFVYMCVCLCMYVCLVPTG